MPPPERRSVPDNLDPLVDTLSNVVGILVIVVVLTQLQLGDALARVAEVDFLRSREERARELMPAEAQALSVRNEALLRRTDRDVEGSILLAEQMLKVLSQPETAPRNLGSESLAGLREELARSQKNLGESKAALDRRDRFAGHLQQVPKKMVARLPDPSVIQGKESWILVRNGRIYLADREKLFERGQAAISRVLGVGIRDRQIRDDEWASVAHYLRKRDTGDGSFRWHLKTESSLRVELAWRNRDLGLEFSDLATNRSMREWLAARSPDVDLIQFQVWSDSFEAYLAAREVIEAAGFRAGWRGYEMSDELELPIRMGRAAPDIRPILVD
jgi:hypothetical protein